MRLATPVSLTAPLMFEHYTRVLRENSVWGLTSELLQTLR